MGDAIDAAPPEPVDAGAPPVKVTVVRAATVADPDSTEPVTESGGRLSWLDGRGMRDSKIPPLDVSAATKARAANFIAVTAVPLPTDVDYVRSARACHGRPVVVQGATPPPPAEVDAAIAEAADSPVLWHRAGTWYRGTVADALLPLRSPTDAVLYLRLKCLAPQVVGVNGQRAFGVFKAGRNVEAFIGVQEDFRPCPHSDMTRTTVLLSITPDGKISAIAKEHHTFASGGGPCVGRDTDGSFRAAGELASDPAAYFAALARDEAVSIDSFERLADELERAGAPAELVARARSASLDEVHHAEAMAAMGSRFGRRPGLPARQRHATRELSDVLLENAREGCVNETYAALAAAYQARTARDPAARELFARIAEDERRHAELAWDIDAWGRERVPGEAHEAIDAARRQAFDRLEAFLAGRADEAWFDVVGEPPTALALAMVQRLRRALS